MDVPAESKSSATKQHFNESRLFQSHTSLDAIRSIRSNHEQHPIKCLVIEAIDVFLFKCLNLDSGYDRTRAQITDGVL
jgi:hypothetical protein